MDLTGKPVEQCAPDFEEPATFIDIGELCIAAKPKQLRKLAKFLKMCAKEMKRGNTSDHYHFRSRAYRLPDVVVLNPKYLPEKVSAEAQAAFNDSHVGYDKNGNMLFLGQEIAFERAGKVCRSTITGKSDTGEIFYGDASVAIPANQVWVEVSQ